MTPDQAKTIVRRKHPGYVVAWCVPYKNYYVVMAHPDEGPEDQEHGSYPDPFYAVDKNTARVKPFVPVFEADFGRSFFEAVRTNFSRQ